MAFWGFYTEGFKSIQLWRKALLFLFFFFVIHTDKWFVKLHYRWFVKARRSAKISPYSERKKLTTVEWIHTSENVVDSSAPFSSRPLQQKSKNQSQVVLFRSRSPFLTTSRVWCPVPGELWSLPPLGPSRVLVEWSRFYSSPRRLRLEHTLPRYCRRNADSGHKG